MIHYAFIAGYLIIHFAYITGYCAAYCFNSRRPPYPLRISCQLLNACP